MLKWMQNPRISILLLLFGLFWFCFTDFKCYGGDRSRLFQVRACVRAIGKLLLVMLEYRLSRARFIRGMKEAACCWQLQLSRSGRDTAVWRRHGFRRTGGASFALGPFLYDVTTQTPDQRPAHVTATANSALTHTQSLDLLSNNGALLDGNNLFFGYKILKAS